LPKCNFLQALTSFFIKPSACYLHPLGYAVDSPQLSIEHLSSIRKSAELTTIEAFALSSLCYAVDFTKPLKWQVQVAID